MKTCLSYEFNDDDGEELLHIQMNARKVHSALWDYDQWLRGKIKYGIDPTDLVFEIQDTWSEDEKLRAVAEQVYQQCRSRLLSEIEL